MNIVAYTGPEFRIYEPKGQCGDEDFLFTVTSPLLFPHRSAEQIY
jgi:hypothetical protein